MMRESRIHAKEQQIKLIDNILCNLCSLELTSDGRRYIKKLKTKISSDLENLKNQQEIQNNGSASTAANRGGLKLPDAFKISW